MITDTNVSSFVGITDSEVAAIADLNDGIGFMTAATALSVAVAKATTANPDTIAGITIAANTWYTCAFHYDGKTAITFYFAAGAGELVEVHQLHLTTTADYIPDDIFLTPTLEAETQTAGGGTMYVDYVLCQQARQRVAD